MAIPANGAYTRNGVPDGATTLTPHIVVQPASEALKFYQDVFGAALLDVTEMGGQITHATLAFAQGRCTVSDPMEGRS
jgi:PhnB protein